MAEVKFVADENGFQPESSILPQAPAFPHEIPQFVLEQVLRQGISMDLGARVIDYFRGDLACTIFY